MTQESFQLFPLRIRSFRPSPWPGADTQELAVTSDQHEFAIKWDDKVPGLPASEWLGAKIAAACQLAVPYTAVLADETGRLGFGSRIEGSSSQFNPLPTLERQAILQQCGPAMSAAIALDYFVGNDDRHLHNWVFRKNTSNAWAPLCIDYSRALFTRGFPPHRILESGCRTRTTQQMLKVLNVWDGPTAVFTLSAIQEIKPSTMKRWLEELPESWLEPRARLAVTSWWGSPEYHSHLQAALACL